MRSDQKVTETTIQQARGITFVKELFGFAMMQTASVLLMISRDMLVSRVPLPDFDEVVFMRLKHSECVVHALVETIPMGL